MATEAHSNPLLCPFHNGNAMPELSYAAQRFNRLRGPPRQDSEIEVRIAELRMLVLGHWRRVDPEIVNG